MKKSELVAQVAAGIKSTKEVKESSKEVKDQEVKLLKKEKSKDKEKALVPESKVIKDKDKKIIAQVTPANKDSLIQEVISHREVKYIYPEDVQDTLSRKSFRQKVRNQLNKLETAMLRIENKDSKEFRKAKKAFNEYRDQFVKVG